MYFPFPPAARPWDLCFDPKKPLSIRNVRKPSRPGNTDYFFNGEIFVTFPLLPDTTAPAVDFRGQQYTPIFTSLLPDLDKERVHPTAVDATAYTLANTAAAAVAQSGYVAWLSQDPIDALAAYAAADLSRILQLASTLRKRSYYTNRQEKPGRAQQKSPFGDANDPKYILADQQYSMAETLSSLGDVLQQLGLAANALRAVHWTRAVELDPFKQTDPDPFDEIAARARDQERRRFPDGRLYHVSVAATTAHLESCLTEFMRVLALTNLHRKLLGMVGIYPGNESSKARDNITNQAAALHKNVATSTDGTEEDDRKRRTEQEAAKDKTPETQEPPRSQQDHHLSGARPLPPQLPDLDAPPTVLQHAQATRIQRKIDTLARAGSVLRRQGLLPADALPAAEPQPHDQPTAGGDVPHQGDAAGEGLPGTDIPHLATPFLTIRVAEAGTRDGNGNLLQDLILRTNCTSTAGLRLGGARIAIKITPDDLSRPSGGTNDLAPTQESTTETTAGGRFN